MTRPSVRDPAPARSGPWWRYPMVWLVVSGPLAVVIAGVWTVTLTIMHPDPELPVVVAGAKGAPASQLPQSQLPATQARNHAAAPQR
jgi:hypothetical protein